MARAKAKTRIRSKAVEELESQVEFLTKEIDHLRGERSSLVHTIQDQDRRLRQMRRSLEGVTLLLGEIILAKCSDLRIRDKDDS